MAQSTSGMFGSLFGLGDVFRAMADPDFQQHARNFLYFIADTHRRVCEIEEMLRHERGFTSTLPAQYGATRTGGHTPPISAYHNGSGGATRPDGGDEPRIFGTGSPNGAGKLAG